MILLYMNPPSYTQEDIEEGENRRKRGERQRAEEIERRRREHEEEQQRRKRRSDEERLTAIERSHGSDLAELLRRLLEKRG